MTIPTIKWRQAGFAGVSAALVAGGALVGMSAASAAPVEPGASSAGQVAVSPGQSPAPSSSADSPDLTYTFGDYNNSSTITASIPGNDCATPSGLAKAVGFHRTTAGSFSVPSRNVDSSDPGTPPTFNAKFASSTNECKTAGITDVIRATVPGSGKSTDGHQYKAILKKIQYDVGDKADLGDINIHIDGTAGLPDGDASNAVVARSTFSHDGFNAADVKTDGVALGTATIKESAAGIDFTKNSTKKVSLGLDKGATFTKDAKAKIDLSEGLELVNSSGTKLTTGAPTPSGGNSAYEFYVKRTGDTPASISVSGLEADSPSDAAQVDMTSNVGTPDSVKALNVVKPNGRIGGLNRYATAAKLFDKAVGSSRTAVLATGEDYADALSASYYAGHENTGTLLTRSNRLSPEAEKAITNNNINKVVIIGGPKAVSSAVEKQIEKMKVGDDLFGDQIKVARLDGANRYATNKRVNEYVGVAADDTVLMASGLNFPDALAMGPIAAKKDYPLILTKGSTVQPTVQSQIESFHAKNVVIAGGPSAVPASIESALNDEKGVTAVRIGGNDRQETAANIGRWATEGLKKDDGAKQAGILGEDQGFASTGVYVATGQPAKGGAQYFADALAAAPLAGQEAQVILLSRNATTPGVGTTDYLGDKTVGTTAKTDVSQITALGQFAVTTDDLVKQLEKAIQK